jgi:hypothetical protein
MKPAVNEVEAILKYAGIAAKVIGERVLTILGFIACAGAFGYALFMPNWERATIASLFAVLVYWPLVRMERRKQAEQESES